MWPDWDKIHSLLGLYAVKLDQVLLMFFSLYPWGYTVNLVPEPWTVC